MGFFVSWIETNKDFLIIGVAISSIVAGLLVEFSKKAWKPLEEKYVNEDVKLAKIKATKAWVSQVIGTFLVIVFLGCVRKDIQVPGGNATLPIWFCVNFLLQYVVSCYGLKAAQRVIEAQRNKPAKEKVAKPKVVKAVRDPQTGELVEV